MANKKILTVFAYFVVLQMLVFNILRQRVNRKSWIRQYGGLSFSSTKLQLLSRFKLILLMVIHMKILLLLLMSILILIFMPRLMLMIIFITDFARLKHFHWEGWLMQKSCVNKQCSCFFQLHRKLATCAPWSIIQSKTEMGRIGNMGKVWEKCRKFRKTVHPPTYPNHLSIADLRPLAYLIGLGFANGNIWARCVGCIWPSAVSKWWGKVW